MKRITLIYFWLLCLVLSVAAQEKVVKLKIVETSDVHGNYYPYNFITRQEWKGSLARIYSFVQKERQQYKDNLILLDNGDILQGQPTAYYYNYIDTVSPHLCAEMMNYMKYDAGNMGNHDVETDVRYSTVGLVLVTFLYWVPISWILLRERRIFRLIRCWNVTV